MQGRPRELSHCGVKTAAFPCCSFIQPGCFVIDLFFFQLHKTDDCILWCPSGRLSAQRSGGCGLDSLARFYYLYYYESSICLPQLFPCTTGAWKALFYNWFLRKLEAKLLKLCVSCATVLVFIQNLRVMLYVAISALFNPCAISAKQSSHLLPWCKLKDKIKSPEYDWMCFLLLLAIISQCTWRQPVGLLLCMANWISAKQIFHCYNWYLRPLKREKGEVGGRGRAN